jgi:hypothetical protein
MRLVALNPRKKRKTPSAKPGKKRKTNPQKGAVIMAKKRRKNPKRRKRHSNPVSSVVKAVKKYRKRRHANPVKAYKRRRKNPGKFNIKGIFADIKPMLFGAGGAIGIDYLFNMIKKSLEIETKWYPYIKLAIALALPVVFKNNKIALSAGLVGGGLAIKDIVYEQFPALELAGYTPMLGYGQFYTAPPQLGFSQFNANPPPPMFGGNSTTSQDFRDFQ